jgi:hypothetical protein
MAAWYCALLSLLLVVLAAAVGLVLLLVVVWLLVMAYVKVTRSGKGVNRFFEAGDGELSPEDQVKFLNNHPGAGGHG